MLTYTIAIIFVVAMFALELVYFKIADRYNIVDRPNERSSHSEVTIRGGGIVFLFVALISLYFFSDYWVVLIGMLIIGTISFIDDNVMLSRKLRLFFHMLAVTLLLYALPVFGIFAIYGVVLLYIAIIGIINAYNFMDGINGITGLYSLVVFTSLLYINSKLTNFVEQNLLLLFILACLVFLFFNFRTRAKCFAGDVGSISIAYILCFLILQLILRTGNPSYLLLLAVYGLDAVTTIIFRVIRTENIFEPHRSHFYQFLANEKKISHLIISAGYAFLQLIINTLLVFNSSILSISQIISIVCCLAFLFIIMRLLLEGPKKLFKSVS